MPKDLDWFEGSTSKEKDKGKVKNDFDFDWDSQANGEAAEFDFSEKVNTGQKKV